MSFGPGEVEVVEEVGEDEDPSPAPSQAARKRTLVVNTGADGKEQASSSKKDGKKRRGRDQRKSQRASDYAASRTLSGTEVTARRRQQQQRHNKSCSPKRASMGSVPFGLTRGNGKALQAGKVAGKVARQAGGHAEAGAPPSRMAVFAATALRSWLMLPCQVGLATVALLGPDARRWGVAVHGGGGGGGGGGDVAWAAVLWIAWAVLLLLEMGLFWLRFRPPIDAVAEKLRASAAATAAAKASVHAGDLHGSVTLLALLAMLLTELPGASPWAVEGDGTPFGGLAGGGFGDVVGGAAGVSLTALRCVRGLRLGLASRALRWVAMRAAVAAAAAADANDPHHLAALQEKHSKPGARRPSAQHMVARQRRKHEQYERQCLGVSVQLAEVVAWCLVLLAMLLACLVPALTAGSSVFGGGNNTPWLAGSGAEHAAPMPYAGGAVGGDFSAEESAATSLLGALLDMQPTTTSAELDAFWRPQLGLTAAAGAKVEQPRFLGCDVLYMRVGARVLLPPASPASAASQASQQHWPRRSHLRRFALPLPAAAGSAAPSYTGFAAAALVASPEAIAAAQAADAVAGANTASLVVDAGGMSRAYAASSLLITLLLLCAAAVASHTLAVSTYGAATGPLLRTLHVVERVALTLHTLVHDDAACEYVCGAAGSFCAAAGLALPIVLAAHPPCPPFPSPLPPKVRDGVPGVRRDENGAPDPGGLRRRGHGDRAAAPRQARRPGPARARPQGGGHLRVLRHPALHGRDGGAAGARDAVRQRGGAHRALEGAPLPRQPEQEHRGRLPAGVESHADEIDGHRGGRGPVCEGGHRGGRPAQGDQAPHWHGRVAAVVGTRYRRDGGGSRGGRG